MINRERFRLELQVNVRISRKSFLSRLTRKNYTLRVRALGNCCPVLRETTAGFRLPDSNRVLPGPASTDITIILLSFRFKTSSKRLHTWYSPSLSIPLKIHDTSILDSLPRALSEETLKEPDQLVSRGNAIALLFKKIANKRSSLIPLSVPRYRS